MLRHSIRQAQLPDAKMPHASALHTALTSQPASAILASCPSEPTWLSATAEAVMRKSTRGNERGGRERKHRQ